MRQVLEPEVRFWRHVMPEPNSGCWLWMASLDGRGYGQINRGDGRPIRAHRLSYEMHKGPIPDGMDLDHKCRVRCCVNPDHLEPVTRQVNILRGESHVARQSRQTHCKNGHEYIAENTVRYRNKRQCRTCSNALRRQRRVR